MSKYIALWEKENLAPCWHLEPVEVENYQVLLDDAAKNKLDVVSIWDVTDENKEPELVYSRPTKRTKKQEVWFFSPQDSISP